MPDFRLSAEDAVRLTADDIVARIRRNSVKANKDVIDPVNDFGDYLRYMFGFEVSRHEQIWVDELMALETAPVPRILAISPPGHAKTTIMGVAYPSWQIGRHPEKHFLYYQAAATQAVKQSVAIRDMILTPKYQAIFPHVQKSKSKSWGTNQWFIEREAAWDKDPTMLAIGVDGNSLGARGDVIIFDDICSPANMSTKGQRDKVRQQVAGVAFSRQGGLSRNVQMIAVMTRWHAEDLSAYFEAEGFKLIWMPAVGYWDKVVPYEKLHGKVTLAEIPKLPFSEELRAGEGEALWPEEYPKSAFTGYINNASDVWELEFLGMTASKSGNLFNPADFALWGDGEDEKHLEPTEVIAIFQFWDTANDSGESHDYWASETWALAKDGYYMLHASREKYNFPAGVMAVESLATMAYSLGGKDPMFAKPRQIYIESTGTGNGAAVVQTLIPKSIPCTPVLPDLGKEARASKAAVEIRTKPFYVSADPKRWYGFTMEEWLDQHMEFPRGAHDDCVDTTSMAANHLAQFPVYNDGSVLRKLAYVEKERLAPSSIARTDKGARFRIKRGQFNRR